MNKTVQVTYNADTFETSITVDGQPFDISRINGKEIADWAYPFMVRKVRWDGFYDEMVAALGGEKAFDLIFEGSEEALAELKEAWEDAPVNVVSGEQNNIVTITYDTDALTTEITVNGQPFDTTRINGKEIEDWVYPFMMRKVRWEGIFDELKAVIGADEYDILFSGTRAAMKVLMEECPETVTIKYEAQASTVKKDTVSNAEADHSLEGTAAPAPEPPIDMNAAASTADEAADLEEQANELFRNERYAEAFPLRKKAAEMGNIIAIGNLGAHYFFGYGVEQDYETALKYYKQAADMGSAWAQNKTGFMYNNGYGCEMNEAMAFSYFMKAAEQDDSEAQYWVGMCYKNGWGVPEDNEKAYSWFSKSHKNGYLGGTRELGCCLWNGWGCSQNKGRAKGLWNEAANKDDGASANFLGEAHFEENNNNKAFFYFNKAYKLGISDAAGNLALCYEMGWGVQKNYRKAVEILEDNLDEHPEYYVQLGKIFFPLNTGYQNYTRAAQYFQKAVEHEYVEGYFMLGICYSEGYGVPKNKEKAKELLQVAADNGHTDAQEYLNDMAKKEGYVDTAKKVGKTALGLLSAFAQGYVQASMDDDDD